MARIRKERAGSDSFGHVWKTDGAVVDIDDPEQIAALMAIPDGGFTEVTPSAGKKSAEPEGELSEIDPDSPDGEPGDKPAPRKAAAKRPGRKPASASDVQE